MKTLLWKELRENIRWALLALLAIGCAEIYALYYQGDPNRMYAGYQSGITLCRTNFEAVTLFANALLGLGLGFLQVLPELKRDRWAALLHRPVSRGRFFWGKAIAGSVLYLLAAGLPYAFCVWLVATPGHFDTPFIPGLLQPGLADLAGGWVWYLAALLAALEGSSRWVRIGSLLAAFFISLLAVQENLLSVVVEAALAMAVVLALAGWGAMHDRENLHGRPWLGRLALMVAVFYGACGAGGLLKLFGGKAGEFGQSRYSVYEVLEDGQPVIETYVEGELITATDWQGEPFRNPEFRAERVRSHTLGMNVASSYIGENHGRRYSDYQRRYRDSNSWLYATEQFAGFAPEKWFHLYREEALVAVSGTSKKVIAALGSNGFAPSLKEARPFAPESPQGSFQSDNLLCIANADSLSIYDLAKRTVKECPLPEPGPVFGFGYTWAKKTATTIDFQGVALSHGMLVIDARGRQKAWIPYHRDVTQWGRISIGVLEGLERFALRYQPSDGIPWEKRRNMPIFVDVVDTSGTVLSSYDLPPLPPNVNATSRASWITQRLRPAGFFFGEMLYRKTGALFGSTRLAEALRRQLENNWKATREVGLGILVVSVFAAASAWGLAHRAHLPPRRAQAWTAFVAMLGVPGFLIFLMMAARPRTVPCAACRRPRFIEHETCAHCAAPWPARPTDGTEILDARAISLVA